MTEAEKRPTFTHRVQYAVYRGFERLLEQAPLDIVAQVGEVLGLGLSLFSAKHRRLVTRNLRITTAEHPLPVRDLKRLVRETFRRAGANMLASQRAATMTLPELLPFMEIRGIEWLQAHAAAGRGTIIVWSHMGNWETLAQLASALGSLKGGPIYRPLENPLLDRMTRERRTQQGAVVFNKHDGFHGPAALLRQGGTVTIMGDQRAGGQGTLCPFFGKLASCTPLPPLLARRTKAAIATLSISRLPSGIWRLNFRPTPDGIDTPTLMRELETAMRDSLPDVFWFQDRWRVDSHMPLYFYNKEIPTEAARAATLPVRILATLPANAPDAVETLLRVLELRPDARIDAFAPAGFPPLPEHPRLVRHEWDPEIPPEHLSGLIDRCDLEHPVPLDIVLLLDGDTHLARAARDFGMRAVIGVGAATRGKPWSRVFERPQTPEGWRQIADDLTYVPAAKPQTP